MCLICCNNLSVFYGKVLAVENLNIKIFEKDYIFVVGENGSGKSTLLKAILNLDVRKKGDVFLNNLKRKEIGYLPQKSSIKKDFPATVFEVVLSGLVGCFGFFYGHKEKDKALKIISKLNLQQIKNISFRELSKGQQQKVLLARALCSFKKILFLDEPCSNLDPLFKNRFYDLIKNLNQKGVSVVMVSHDVKAAVLNAKKILHMQKKALFFGDVKSYLKTSLGKNFLK